jgi:DNA polymerase IV
MERYIMHVDMDAFFASVEQRDHEEYRGKPVIVGGQSVRGVVATASYEARAFGVHSAMPMAIARRRCPEGIFVSGNHAHYQEVSQQIFGIFHDFSPAVEALSIDEAFLDISGMEKLMKNCRAYGQKLKKKIYLQTGLIASVGIAPNKFLAKLASDLEKPDGLVIIASGEIKRVLWPLPISRLWGVGGKTEERLHRLGYENIGQVAQAGEAELCKNFGQKLSRQLVKLANGRDDRLVETEREAQSVGNEVTFEQDIVTQEEAEAALLALAEKVGWRLRRVNCCARTIQLKVRLGDFTTYTRSRTLSAATCYDEDIYGVARELFHALHVHSGIRLLGITGSSFDIYGQASLFEDNHKKEELYSAIDGLKKRFGYDIINHLNAKKKKDK